MGSGHQEEPTDHWIGHQEAEGLEEASGEQGQNRAWPEPEVHLDECRQRRYLS